MRRLVDLKILNRLDWLIRHAATGTPDEFAEWLGMSRSSFYELIAYMKDEMQAPIIFDNTRPSYIYEYPPKFYLGFERESLDTTELQNTFGGVDMNEEKVVKTETETGKKKGKRTIEIEINEDECILDTNIDFNDLYF